MDRKSITSSIPAKRRGRRSWARISETSRSTSSSEGEVGSSGRRVEMGPREYMEELSNLAISWRSNQPSCSPSSPLPSSPPEPQSGDSGQLVAVGRSEKWASVWSLPLNFSVSLSLCQAAPLPLCQAVNMFISFRILSTPTSPLPAGCLLLFLL